MKTLDTLAKDIDQLFFEGTQVSEENLQLFAKNIADLLRERLLPKPKEDPKLRMSKLGTPDRKLWYEHHHPLDREQGKHALKFVYGDIVEQLIIFLAKECGHSVEDEQREFEIDGIKGHQDCKLDGVVVDVKSASSLPLESFLNELFSKTTLSDMWLSSLPTPMLTAIYQQLSSELIKRTVKSVSYPYRM
jgi:hypothetical protein